MHAIDTCEAVNRPEDAGTTRRTAEIVEDTVGNAATDGGLAVVVSKPF